MWSIGVTLKPEGSKMCRKNERSVSYNVWMTGTGVGVGVSLWLKVCGVPPKWEMWNPIMTSSPMHVRLWGGISRVDTNVFTSCEVLQCWLRGLVWCNTHAHTHTCVQCVYILQQSLGETGRQKKDVQDGRKSYEASRGPTGSYSCHYWPNKIQWVCLCVYVSLIYQTQPLDYS